MDKSNPVGGPQHVPQSPPFNVARALITSSEEISSIYPRFMRGINSNANYQAVTSKKGMTAAVFGRRSVTVQSSKAVRPSPAVASLLKQAGQQQPGKPMAKGRTKKHH